MMLNGGELNGIRVLAPSTVSLLLENHTGDLKLWLSGPGMGFGLGFLFFLDRNIYLSTMLIKYVNILLITK